MGNLLSHDSPTNPTEYFKWELGDHSACYFISPVFAMENENFVAFSNSLINSIVIYCCSASQWNYDETIPFTIEIIADKSIIRTKSCMTRVRPFVSIKLAFVPSDVDINIKLSSGYPYIRKTEFIGVRNMGSTCYMACILQILYQIGAFRDLIYSFKNPKPAPLALQKIFIDLQVASQPISLVEFIRSLGSVSDLAMIQHDAQEFFIELLSRLENDLDKEFTDYINQLFASTQQSTILYEDNTIIKNETLLTIPLVVDGVKSIEESLTLMTAREKLENYENGEAYQSQVFTKLAPILAFHLCRYKYNPKTNNVEELRSSFQCQQNLDMSPYCKCNDSLDYELFAVVAHSGTPEMGHYISFVKMLDRDEWMSFDDTAVIKVEFEDVARTFDGSAGHNILMRTISYGYPISYMLFYIQSNRKELLITPDEIPIHLAPHKSNKFFSRFRFYPYFLGQQVNFEINDFEWDDYSETFDTLIQDFTGQKYESVSIWAQMPGRSQFIGPIPIDSVASNFIVKGLSTDFFILPKQYDEGPVFIVSSSIPREYIDVVVINEYNKTLKKKVDPDLYPPGSFLRSASRSKPRKLIVQNKYYSAAQNAKYEDLQEILGKSAGISPSRILLYTGGEPMRHKLYPYVSYFPTASTFQIQNLDEPITVYSLSLYVPVKVTVFSNKIVKVIKQPFWMSKNSTCADLITKVTKEYPSYFRYSGKFKLQSSRGKTKEIEKILNNKHILKKNENIRIDVIRYGLVDSKSLLLKMIKQQIPMSIEIRVQSAFSKEIARIISIDKSTTCRDACQKISRISGLFEQFSSIYLVGANKPKLKKEISIDSVLYVEIKNFVSSIRGFSRICLRLESVGAIYEKEMRLNRNKSMFKIGCSLSGPITPINLE